MWTCHLCNRSFKSNNQIHYCGDKTVSDFLLGKSETAVDLFDHLILKFEEIGPIHLHATKSMIVISGANGFAYVISLGKSFIDVVLPFTETYEENLCFRKIAHVPNSKQYNHHLRMMVPEDINDEVFDYMKKAYANGKRI